MYHAKVERDGKYWLVHVPEIDKYTQARNLREVERVARDLIAIIEEVEPESFEIEVSIELPEEAADHWGRSKQLHELSDALKAEAAEEAREAVKSLTALGLTLREAGQSLGVSFQRAGQLVADVAPVQRKIHTALGRDGLADILACYMRRAGGYSKVGDQSSIHYLKTTDSSSSV